jgi:hypothetical protein
MYGESRDLKLTAWFCLLLNSLADLKGLNAKIPQLDSIVKTFVTNIKRVLRMATFPEALYHAGRRVQLGESIAFWEIHGHPFPEDVYGQIVPPEVGRRRDEILDGATDHRLHMSAPISSEELILAAQMDNMVPILEDSMLNQITSAWTVFEIMFGDMWEAAIDSGSTPRLDSKGAPLKNLTRYFARFQGGQGVIATYAAAFHVDGGAIINALSDKSLLGLFAVRNLIGHKAGKCDDKYLDYAKQLPQIPQLALGDTLKPDGVIVSELVRPALRCCIRLIRETDDWLLKHP